MPTGEIKLVLGLYGVHRSCFSFVFVVMPCVLVHSVFSIFCCDSLCYELRIGYIYSFASSPPIVFNPVPICEMNHIQMSVAHGGQGGGLKSCTPNLSVDMMYILKLPCSDFDLNFASL